MRFALEFHTGRHAALLPCSTLMYQSDIMLISKHAGGITARGRHPMDAPNEKNGPGGLRGWWKSSPRSGVQLIIAPWEYRHLRGWARVRIASGAVLVVLGLLTLGFGGTDWKTYGWAIGFVAAATAQFGVRLLVAAHRSLAA
jgi:hypothetical protein